MTSEITGRGMTQSNKQGQMRFETLDRDAGRLSKTLSIIAFFLNYECSKTPSCNYILSFHGLKCELRNIELLISKQRFKNYGNKFPSLSGFNLS